MIVMTHCLCLWDLSKNMLVYTLPKAYAGCHIQHNKCLAWLENTLDCYSIGLNKNKSITMRL